MIWVFVMSLAWVVGCGMVAVGLAALILHVCWKVEDRARRRARGGDVDLTGVRF